MASYIQDKNAFIKWVLGVCASGILLFQGAIYQENRIQTETLIMVTTKMSVSEKKDEEQDRRLDQHDKVLFDLPKRITLKYNEQQD